MPPAILSALCWLSPLSLSVRPQRPASTRSGGMECPSCSLPLTPKSARRHQAFCCPDLLDPEGWKETDRRTVLAHVRQAYPARSLEQRLISTRFPERGPPPSQKQLSAMLHLSPRKTRDTLARILHAIPPPPEQSEGLEVVYEDEWLIAVNKPAALPVTPPHRLRTVPSPAPLPPAPLLPFSEHLDANTRAPVHRLDRNTSGVLAFAKTSWAAARMMRQFEERRVKKTCERTPRLFSCDMQAASYSLLSLFSFAPPA
ncbi:MAG: hypothetical protein SGPRY_004636 [Prymnesium sp.]